MRHSGDFSTLPMPELRLYHSPKKCAKFLERHGVQFEPIEGVDAQTWTFRGEGTAHAVVLYGARGDYPYWTEMGLLSHEATHIALYALGEVGEDEPAEEEVCYVVQAISTWLCEAHFKWKERKLEGKK